MINKQIGEVKKQAVCLSESKQTEILLSKQEAMVRKSKFH